jgi:uncharacterized protein YkwD
MHELTTTSHSSKSHRIILSSITNATTKQPTRSNRRGTQQQQQQERTGRQSIASVTADQQKGTQQRIAARAATAMAQFRKRQPRNFLSWGDNRKVRTKGASGRAMGRLPKLGRTTEHKVRMMVTYSLC